MFLANLSIPFLISNLIVTSPLKQAYSLSLPTHINLSSNGNFEISILDESMSDSETINIDIDDEFTLSDSHGRGNIKGTTSNNHISFSNNDLSTKVISYNIENALSGSYIGNLNLSISFETNTTPNILSDGTSINNILKTINPTTITFSHEKINGNYSYDLSKDKDESILLYLDGTDVVISNGISDKIIANENMSGIFSNISNLTQINNLNYLDTSNTTNMSGMFRNCTNLSTIDVSNFDTSSCTNMSYMFDMNSKCTSIGNISNWDVSKVTTFENFLYYNMKLSNYGDLGKWKVSSACTNMKNMFSETSYTPNSANSSTFVSSLDLSGWDVSSVKDMSFMFKNATGMQTLNLTNWNTSSLEKMEGMFWMADSYNTSKLTTITGLSDLDVSKVTNMNRIFYKCTNLAASGFEKWKPSSLTSITYGFYYCRNMDISGTSGWDAYFPGKVSMSNCFGKNAGYYTNTSAPSWYK